MRPAFITGLPRSRTFWFAEYFQACGVTAYHELLNGIESRSRFYQVMEDGCINSDCGLIITDFQVKFPDAPCVIIHRDPQDVHRSLLLLMDEMSLPCPTVAQLIAWQRKLEQLEGMHVAYHDINDQLEVIHKYLAPDVPYDVERASHLMEVNMQVSPATYTIDLESARLWAA